MEINGFSGTQEMNSSISVKRQQARPSKKEMEELNADLSKTIAEQLLEEKDANGDGVLSAEELGLSDETFEALETEAGSYATVEELANYIKTKIGEKMQENKPPEGERPQGPPPSQSGSDSPKSLISEVLSEMGISDTDSKTIIELLQTSSINVDV